MLLSLRLGFVQNLANYVLDVASMTSFLLFQKPLIQVGVDALLENGQTFNTNNYFMRQK